MKLSRWDKLTLMTTGPFILGALTLGVAWVLRGFKPRSREKKSETESS